MKMRLGNLFLSLLANYERITAMPRVRHRESKTTNNNTSLCFMFTESI